MDKGQRHLLHGLIAEFETPADLIEAARRTREAGYRKIDAYSPYPIHELTEALALPRTKLPIIVFIGGALGCATALSMQWFASVVHYPLNVGGRPFASWPSFIPITFELTVLFAAIAAVLGMLGLNGLPMPYHPVFNVPRFALASRDRFFLSIEARDPQFDLAKTSEFLRSLGAREVTEVEV
jgi:ActD protein